MKTQPSEDELRLDPELAAIFLDWKRAAEEVARKILTDGKPTFLAWNCCFSDTSPCETSTRLRSSRTISVLLDALLVTCPKCGAAAEV
jgi:hypothetical protein